MQSIIHKDVQVAYDLAKCLHAGQKRRNGEEYFSGHLKPVYELILDEFKRYEAKQEPCQAKIFNPNDPLLIAAQVGALLHDSIEDNKISEIDLRKKINPFYVHVIMLVTRKKGQTYFDFINSIIVANRVIGMPARIIKVADLRHNMSNLEEGSMRDKYRFAFSALTGNLPPY